jgi:hypothetical protein
MSEAKSTEDFVRIRAAFDEQVRNTNSVTTPIPWYQGEGGRYFMGWKQLPADVQQAA